MKELWIHAGMPKNGSSALQVFFAQNLNRLREEGLDYIELVDLTDARQGEITASNGFRFAQSMLDKNHEAYLEDKNHNLLNQIISRIQTSKFSKFLLSSEYFIVVPYKEIENLNKHLLKNKIRLKFIYYVRRQDQFLVSAYMQRVKRHGYSDTPEKFILDYYKNTEFLNYFTVSKAYESILGKENLYVFIYERTKDHSNGIVGHFIKSILGKNLSWIEEQNSINTSPNLLELKILLSSNRFDPRTEFSDIIVKNSAKINNSSKYQLHNIIPERVMHSILEYFRKENEMLFIEYTKNEKFDEYLPQENINFNDINFTQKEFIDVMSGLFVEFDKKISRLTIQQKEMMNEFKKIDNQNIVSNKTFINSIISRFRN